MKAICMFGHYLVKADLHHCSVAAPASYKFFFGGGGGGEEGKINKYMLFLPFCIEILKFGIILKHL